MKNSMSGYTRTAVVQIERSIVSRQLGTAIQGNPAIPIWRASMTASPAMSGKAL